MSLKSLALCLIGTLLSPACLSNTARAQENNALQTTKAGISEEWMQAHYATLRENLLPERLDIKVFPDGVKWITVVVARDAFNSSEYWFSFSVKYDGSIELTVRQPRSGSIAAQLRELQKKRPGGTVESLLPALQIDESRFTDKWMPSLRQLATEYEDVRISPVMPDTLMPDAYAYHIWSQTLYGQEISMLLVGLGPEAKNQPHPMIRWAEHVRNEVNKTLSKR